MKNFELSAKDKRFVWGGVALGLIVIAVIVICFGRCGSSDSKISEPKKVVTKADVIMAISKISKLYTAEQEAHKTMRYQSDNSYDLDLFGRTLNFRVPLGHLEANIPVTAKYKASIDISKIDSTCVKIVNDSTIQITLPDPVIEETACTIDHDNESMKRQVWAQHMDDATYQSIIRKAKDDIWNDISEEQYNALVETAKVSATEVLLPMMRDLHFKNIQIDFRSDLDTKHSSKFLERRRE